MILLLSTVNCQLSTLYLSRISPLAWVAIAVIVIITLIINIALVALLRVRNTPPRSTQGRKYVEEMARVVQVMHDPFGKERGQLDELSRLVSGLDEKPAAHSSEEGTNPAGAQREDK